MEGEFVIRYSHGWRGNTEIEGLSGPLRLAQKPGDDLPDHQHAIRLAGVQNAVHHGAAGFDVKQFGKLLRLIAEYQKVIALNGVVDALLGHEAFRQLGIGNGYEGIELPFVLKILFEVSCSHNVAGADVQAEHG
jgi:hypothetical protein